MLSHIRQRTDACTATSPQRASSLHPASRNTVSKPFLRSCAAPSSPISIPSSPNTNSPPTTSKKLSAIRPEPGDLLLVRTGFARLWHDEAAYLKAAGAHKSATIWAADHKVSAVGADNMAWDVPGIVDAETGVTLFAHFYLLPQKGIYIIENLTLEELASTGVKECLFVCLPLKLTGATGSPVRPIALL